MSKITKKTEYVTNGKAVIRLGFYNEGSHPEKKLAGTFYNCKYWPKNSPDVKFIGCANKEGRGEIPEMWLIPYSDGSKPFLKDFIKIDKALIAANILEYLEN